MEASSKAARRDEDDNSDRISELPDPILHYIYSFLDIQHVIQTAFLTKRWITTFTTIPILNLDQNTVSAPRHEINGVNFSDFVDGVLRLRDITTNVDNNNHTSNNLRLLRVSCFDKNMDMNHANRWSDFAVRHNVEEFELELLLRGYIQHYLLAVPHHVSLFSCKLLNTLKLSSDWLIIPDDLVVDLPKLKTLHLQSLCFHGEKINENFFWNCPVLETLIITYCGIENDTLNIIVSEYHQLKYLKIESLLVGTHMVGTDGSTLQIVTVSAPKLTSLTVKQESGEAYNLVNIPSLVDVHIEVGSFDFASLKMFLKAISHVKSLTLSPALLKEYDRMVELHAADGLKAWFNPFHSLRSLTLLKTTLSRSQIRVITYLLEKCPKVENIALEMSTLRNQNVYEKIECWKSELLLQLKLHHLKFIEIRDSTGCRYELEFLIFLLTHTPVLEKIFIFPRKNHLFTRNTERFRDILETSTRESSTAEILFL